MRIVCSAAAAARIEAAHRFVADQGPAADCLVVGESRRALDDFARDAAARSGASFGLQRFGVRQLAVRLAGPLLGRRGCRIATGLNVDAVAARAAFEARRAGELGALEAVARLPSFART